MHINIGQIGQAPRMARCHGIDREYQLINNHEISQKIHAQVIWWTICVLDQRYSASINATPDYRLQDHNDFSSLPNEIHENISGALLSIYFRVLNAWTRVMAGTYT